MNKKLIHRLATIIFVGSFLFGFTNEANAQQRRWVLPYMSTTSNNDIMPIVDFSTGVPVFQTKTVNEYYSSQSVGNGEYCNSCSSLDTRISEFFFTGNRNQSYNSCMNPAVQNPIVDLKPVMLTWDQICGPQAIQNVLQLSGCTPTNPSGTDPVGCDLSHESVTEIALGNGEHAGEFWALIQRSQLNQDGDNGLGFYIYLMNMNNGTVAANQQKDIDLVLDNSIAGGVSGYNEAVALGPKFIYATEVGDNAALQALNGKWVRSIYIVAGDYTYHLFLEVSNFNIVYSDRFNNIGGTNGLVANRIRELDLSFPVANGVHPQYLGTTGWDGVALLTLNVNGKMLSQKRMTTTAGGYGLEFDRQNKFFYYSTAASNALPSLYRHEIAAGTTSTNIAPVGLTLSPTWNYITMETAITGDLYLLTSTGNFIQLDNPWLSTAPAYTSYNLSTEYTGTGLVSSGFGMNLPDWVDGEEPMSIEGSKLTVCVDAFGCETLGDQKVDIVANGVHLQTYYIAPGGCQDIYLCPDVQYHVIFNDGEDQEFLWIGANQNYTVNFSAGNIASFLNYTSNTTISSNVMWDDKVYIGDNVTLTVGNGATLDITNVDVIFGKCAQIFVEKGARIRANNSVFRPCSPFEVWKGIIFDEDELSQNLMPDGWFNECTFKNAKTAIFFTGIYTSWNRNLETRVKVTNNLFSNCQIGLGALYCNLTESITGNTFYQDNNYPNYTLWNCNPFVSDNRRGGILAWDAIFRGEISQNDFVYSDKEQYTVTAIDLGYCAEATVSNNNFTNCNRAIQIRDYDLGTHGGMRVEGNNIIVSDHLSTLEPQISVYRSQKGVIISGNTLFNANAANSTTASLVKNAIYLETSDNAIVRNNEIVGFETGINLKSTGNSLIVNNNIKDSWYYGIYTTECNEIDISCNEIDMDMRSNRSTIGIGIYQLLTGSQGMKIRNNCVFESKSAIYTKVNTTGLAGSIPFIRNNFLFNYKNFGIENINFLGSLGTSVSSANAGKNTFRSNDVSAVDVSSNTSISMFGNYGVQNASSTVTQTGSNIFNSTASCGLQINTSVTAIEEYQNCETTSFVYKSLAIGEPGPNSSEGTILVQDPTHEQTDIVYSHSVGEILISPNPVTDLLNIQLVNILSQDHLQIVGLTGNIIKEVLLNGETTKFELNVSDLPAGMYFVKVLSLEKHPIVTRFIVTH